jgi:hypothetical protein
MLTPSAARLRPSTPGAHASMPGSAPRVSSADLRFEHHREPFGVGERPPRLSWTVETPIPAGARPPTRSRRTSRGARPAASPPTSRSPHLVLRTPGVPRARRGARARLGHRRLGVPAERPPPRWRLACWMPPTGARALSPWSGTRIRPSPPSPLLPRDFELRAPAARARLRGRRGPARRTGTHGIAEAWPVSTIVESSRSVRLSPRT